MERFNKLRQSPLTPPSAPLKNSKKKKSSNVDDTDSEADDDDAATPQGTADPWLQEWTLYKTTHEVVPDGMGIVEWWGVRQSISFICSFS